MATVDHNTPATRLAFDRMDAAVADSLAGRPAYPSGTIFIGADVAGAGNSIARAAREGKPIVIVYPDGEERFLVPTPHPSAAL